MNDTKDTAAEIESRFEHHPPGPATKAVHETLRFWYTGLAAGIATYGSSREMSLALTALEESLMWANKHVARNLDPETGGRR